MLKLGGQILANRKFLKSDKPTSYTKKNDLKMYHGMKFNNTFELGILKYTVQHLSFISVM